MKNPAHLILKSELGGGAGFFISNELLSWDYSPIEY
jgi:hypothetical protein